MPRHITSLPADLRASSIALFGSAGLLIGAFAFQYIGGLAPCVLCIYQRYPHAATVALALVALLAAARYRRLVPTLLLAIALVYGIGAGIAGFHVGVEQNWWEGLPSCGAAGGSAMTAEDLTRQLFATPVVRCDEVAWSLLGISMAGYNFLISVALMAICGAAGLTGPREGQTA